MNRPQHSRYPYESGARSLQQYTLISSAIVFDTISMYFNFTLKTVGCATGKSWPIRRKVHYSRLKQTTQRPLGFSFSFKLVGFRPSLHGEREGAVFSFVLSS